MHGDEDSKRASIWERLAAHDARESQHTRRTEVAFACWTALGGSLLPLIDDERLRKACLGVVIAGMPLVVVWAMRALRRA